MLAQTPKMPVMVWLSWTNESNLASGEVDSKIPVCLQWNKFITDLSSLIYWLKLAEQRMAVGIQRRKQDGSEDGIKPYVKYCNFKVPN